jgi:DNA-binding phage protein
VASSSALACASDPACASATPAPPPVAIVVDDAIVLSRLRAAVTAAGSQRAYARAAGLNRGDLSSALSHRRPPTTALRRAVGVEAALVLREAAR